VGARGRREATLNPAQLGLVRLGRRMNAHHENGSAALRPKLTGNIAMACLERTHRPIALECKTPPSLTDRST